MSETKSFAVSGQDAALIDGLHKACQQLIADRDADLSEAEVEVAACAKWVCNTPPFGNHEDVAGHYGVVTCEDNRVLITVDPSVSLPTLGRFLQGVVQLTSLPSLSIVVVRSAASSHSLTGVYDAVAIVARSADWQLLSLEEWIASTLSNKPLNAIRFAGVKLKKLAAETVQATPACASEVASAAQGARRKAFTIVARAVRRS